MQQQNSVSELLRRLITERDELVEEVDTLRETLRVSRKPNVHVKASKTKQFLNLFLKQLMLFKN